MIDRLMIKDAMKRYDTSVNEVADKMGISRVTLLVLTLMEIHQRRFF